MKRSVEFDCATRSPLNGSQGTSPGARRAAKAFKDEQRRKTFEALAKLTPPSTHVVQRVHDGGAVTYEPVGAVGMVFRNKWHVKIVRVAIGVMDPGIPIEGRPGARTCSDAPFKAIQDALAEWCGEKDERRPPWASWTYEQEQPAKERFGEHARFVQRVRIELTDMLTAEDRPVVLAETGSEGRAAASRVKRAVTAQTRKATRTAPVQGVPHAADCLVNTSKLGRCNCVAGDGLGALRAKARSVACPAFTKISALTVTCSAAPGAPCDESGEIISAWEYGVHVARARAAGCPPMPTVAALNRGERPQLGPDGDEDKSPRMLVPCAVHGAAIGEWCNRGALTVCDARKRLAGLKVAGERVLTKAPTNGALPEAHDAAAQVAAVSEARRPVPAPRHSDAGSTGARAAVRHDDHARAAPVRERRDGRVLGLRGSEDDVSSLHVWCVDDEEYVIAKDAEDAAKVMAEIGFVPDDEQTVQYEMWPDDKPFTFCDGNDAARAQTKTAAEWAGERGRGWFAMSMG